MTTSYQVGAGVTGDPKPAVGLSVEWPGERPAARVVQVKSPVLIRQESP